MRNLNFGGSPGPLLPPHPFGFELDFDKMLLLGFKTINLDLILLPSHLLELLADIVYKHFVYWNTGLFIRWLLLLFELKHYVEVRLPTCELFLWLAELKKRLHDTFCIECL